MGTGMSFLRDEILAGKKNKNVLEINRAYEVNRACEINSICELKSILEPPGPGEGSILDGRLSPIREKVTELRRRRSLQNTAPGQAHQFAPIDGTTFNSKLNEIKLALSLDSFNRYLTYNLRRQNLEDYESEVLPDEDIIFYTSLLNPKRSLHFDLTSGEGSEELKVCTRPPGNIVDLCTSDLVEVSPILFRLTHITSLQLCHNYIKFLPYGISQMGLLKSLSLNRNELIAIPQEVGSLKELRELDLGNNRITSLPKSLACLKNLNTLKLEHNLFTEIPSFLGKIQSLKLLNLSFNPIAFIPFEIFKLPFLMSLNTAGCQLKRLENTTFEENGTLTLQESLARSLIRQNHRVNRNITQAVRSLLFKVQECCFCGGPFFDYFVQVEDNHVYEGEEFPINYRMCSLHYKRHEERISTLFERRLKTFPAKLFQESLPYVLELFEPTNYDMQKLLVSYEQKAPDGKMPLVCLTLFNKGRRMHTVEEVFASEAENLNEFDLAYSL